MTTIVRDMLQGNDVSMNKALGVLDHPLFLASGEKGTPTLEEYQEFNRLVRQTLLDKGLLEDARTALFPLANMDADSRDCRECRVLRNLLVPAGEQPNPEWVGV